MYLFTWCAWNTAKVLSRDGRTWTCMISPHEPPELRASAQAERTERANALVARRVFRQNKKTDVAKLRQQKGLTHLCANPWCGWQDLNLHGFPHEPESCASANFATSANTIANAIFRHRNLPFFAASASNSVIISHFATLCNYFFRLVCTTTLTATNRWNSAWEFDNNNSISTVF